MIYKILKTNLQKNSFIYAHKTRRKRNIMKMSIKLEAKSGLQTATNNPRTNNTRDSIKNITSLSRKGWYPGAK